MNENVENYDIINQSRVKSNINSIYNVFRKFLNKNKADTYNKIKNYKSLHDNIKHEIKKTHWTNKTILDIYGEDELEENEGETNNFNGEEKIIPNFVGEYEMYNILESKVKLRDSLRHNDFKYGFNHKKFMPDINSMKTLSSMGHNEIKKLRRLINPNKFRFLMTKEKSLPVKEYVPN